MVRKGPLQLSSTLQTLVTLASPESQLHLLDSEMLPGSTWVPLAQMVAWKLSPGGDRGNHALVVSCLLVITVHYLMSIVFKTIVSYFFPSFLVVLGVTVNLAAVTSSWSEVEVLATVKHSFKAVIFLV